MTKSKQANTSKGEDGVDMISNLPDDILHMILSRVPNTFTEELIRTSILSRRWRYLWTSIPSIDIDYTRGLDPLDRLDSNGFKDFVYWVLINKPMDVDTFRLWCAKYYNMSTIRRWIHAAVMRKVKLLDLMFCPREDSEVIEVPHCLVTCGSLEVLRLCLMGCPLSLPKYTGFKALRVLELTDLNLFDDNIVKYFLESCPLLEDLSLIDCCAYELVISSQNLKNLIINTCQRVTDEELSDEDLDLDWLMCTSLEVSCPKLEFLKLIDYVATEFNFESLYSLKKAVIHAQELFDYDEPEYDLFHELCHVESLSISLYCVEQVGSRKEEPISLPNLKTLALTVDHRLHVLIPFLRCLPDLEYLHLIFPKKLYGLDKWNKEEAIPATMSILTRHLKKVVFIEFQEEKPELVLARSLLEHGNELEEMVFSWGDEAKFHERSMEIINQVSKFQKASFNVKIRCVINPSQVPEKSETDPIQVE